jgi:hypothetical protein
MRNAVAFEWKFCVFFPWAGSGKKKEKRTEVIEGHSADDF